MQCPSALPARPNGTALARSHGLVYGRVCQQANTVSVEDLPGGKDCPVVQYIGSGNPTTPGYDVKYTVHLDLFQYTDVHEIALTIRFTAPPTQLPILSGVRKLLCYKYLITVAPITFFLIFLNETDKSKYSFQSITGTVAPTSNENTYVVHALTLASRSSFDFEVAFDKAEFSTLCIDRISCETCLNCFNFYQNYEPNDEEVNDNLTSPLF